MTQASDPKHVAKKELTASMARQQVMADGANKVAEVVHGDMYRVPAGWECEQLRNDANVTHATSAVTLEAAVQNPACETIFVPRQSALTIEMVKKITDRNSGQHPTIFWEA